MQAMALAQVFQDAADCGPAAFAAAIEVHGAPTVLSAVGAAAELDMPAYGFSVPGAAQTDMQGLSTRLDDLVSATSVSFGGASFKHDGAGHAPAAAAAVAVGVQCEATSDDHAKGQGDRILLLEVLSETSHLTLNRTCVPKFCRVTGTQHRWWRAAGSGPGRLRPGGRCVYHQYWPGQVNQPPIWALEELSRFSLMSIMSRDHLYNAHARHAEQLTPRWGVDESGMGLSTSFSELSIA
ncbi:hypothetical protein CYMTET_49603 [Cymbomonas tetramitiformis]|uniref:Uncharacterized protein n=1 Tax=Cymbomonas tetramitiformis TaxID=36881 RepID=A0AAE0ETZ2_9CHLO|nr:hypothetical protein CYMTET_49603 [Cymbomonas tetramitiformis]